MTPLEEKQRKNRFWLVVVIVIVCIVVSYWSGFKLGSTMAGYHVEVGLVNWSYVATVLGAPIGIVSIVLLFFTFREQKKELHAAQEALKAQETQMIVQNKTLSVQRFETTFFQLIGFQNSIVRDIEYKNDQGTVVGKGRIAFMIAYNLFNERINDERLRAYQKNPSIAPSADVRHLAQIKFDQTYIEGWFDQFYKKIQSDFEHYYNNLHQTLLFIENSDQIEEKRFYTRIIRSQLSGYERKFLYFYGLGFEGELDFKNLIEKYGLLHNIKPNELFYRYEKNDYEKTAYVD